MSFAQRIFIITSLLVSIAGNLFAQPALTSWNGKVNTAWNNAGNWSAGLPGTNTDVVISAVTNAPVIATMVQVRSVYIQAGGSLTTSTTGTLMINGSVDAGIHNNGTLQNNGTLFIGNTASTGSYGLRNFGTVTNAATGQMHISRVKTSGIDNYQAIFNNLGTIRIGAVAETPGRWGINNSGNFTNSAGGQVSINRVEEAIIASNQTMYNTGTITVGDIAAVPYLVSPLGLGTFSNSNGGLLAGAGTIESDRFINAGGKLSAGSSIGKLSFTASREDFSNSILYLKIYGAARFDQVQVNGTATLGGKLELNIAYLAAEGDRILLFSASGGITGTFSSITGLEPNWKIDYTANEVVLVYDKTGNYWTGAVNTDWNNAGNWTAGVPTVTSNVVVADVTNNPVINTANAVAQSVIVNPGGELTINNAGSLAINRAMEHGLLNKGTIQNNGAINIGNTAGANLSGLRNEGTLYNNAGANIRIDRTKNLETNLQNTGTFSNAGQITIGGNAPSGSYGLNAAGIFNNLPTGKIIIDHVTLQGLYVNGTLNNEGKINLGEGFPDSPIDMGLVLGGVLNNKPGGEVHIGFSSKAIVPFGRIGQLNNTGLVSAKGFEEERITNILIHEGEAMVQNLPGGLFRGRGNVDAARFINAGGTLAPGTPMGKIVFLASEDLSNGTLSMDVNGITRAGLDFDQVTVNGTATLGGTLALSVKHTGVTGDRVTLLTATALSGTFSTVTGLPAGGKLEYSPTALSLVFANVPVESPLSSWTGAVNTDWNNNGNWSAGIPSAITEVTIPDVTNDPVINTATGIAKSLKILSGGSLTIGTAGVLVINAGTNNALHNQGTVHSNGTINIGNLSAAGINGIFNEGIFNNKEGATLSIDRIRTTAIYNASQQFNNTGTIHIGANAATGVDGIDNYGLFNNYEKGQLYIDRVSSAGLYNASTTGFNNEGIFHIGGLAAGNNFNWGIYNGGRFSNTTTGQIQVNRVQSALAVSASEFSNAGKIAVGNDPKVTTLLAYPGPGTFSNNPGGTIQGAGEIAAPAFFNKGGSLQPGNVIGKINFSSFEDFSNSTIAIDVNGSGVAGTNYDQVVVNGTATLGGKLALSVNYAGIPGDQLTLLSATALSGTFATVTGLPLNWQIQYTTNAVVLVREKDKYVWTGNMSSAWNTAGNWSLAKVPGATDGVVLTATGAARELIINIAATIESVQIATGRTLTVNLPGKLTVTKQLINHGTIKGTGTVVIPSFTNTGTIAPGNSPGTLTIDGNFINEGIIEAEISGHEPGTQYDQLAVTGTVQLGGHLVITPIDGFKMTPGQTFSFVKGSAVTGQFASVTWPAGTTGTVTYLNDAVVLSVAATLPLKLLSFTGRSEQGKTVLQWKTAQEENTASFDVERSPNGSNYAVIGRVKAAGSGANNYTFTDVNPEAGNNYYRLNMKDIDGRSTFSQVVQVRSSQAASLQIGPVPATTYLTLTLRGQGTSQEQAQIYNTAGVLMKSILLTGSTRLDIAGWPAGTYIIRTQTDTYRFIKQ